MTPARAAVGDFVRLDKFPVPVLALKKHFAAFLLDGGEPYIKVSYQHGRFIMDNL